MTQLEQLKKSSAQRIKNANSRVRQQRLEGALVRHGANIATAAAIGTMNRYGVPATVGGFPWKIGAGALALLGEATTGGAVQSALSGIASGMLAVYVERSITGGTLVAGGDYGGGNL